MMRFTNEEINNMYSWRTVSSAGILCTNHSYAHILMLNNVSTYYKILTYSNCTESPLINRVIPSKYFIVFVSIFDVQSAASVFDYV